MSKLKIRLLWAAAVLMAAVLTAVALRPAPVPVDLAPARRGPLQVTVDEDGQTRIRERYVVSTPIGGRLLRVELKEGDPVRAGETVLAVVEPQDPQFLDNRERAQAEAREKAAEAAHQQAEALLDKARSADEFARNEHGRISKLYERDIITGHEMERVEMEARSAAADLRGAGQAMQIARFELEQARAALLHAQGQEGNPEEGVLRFVIRSPIDGKVLRLIQESSTVVTPGTAVAELGDPADLEVVVDVLSTDAVQIRPGAAVRFEHWGGEEPLTGRVRLIEPSAFTKISALGVEEQRVWVVIDFSEPPERLAWLGDGYRVEARIVVWEADEVVQVPAGALFRDRGQWSLFVAEDGRARLQPVERGRSNGFDTEIRSGLEAGAEVVLHPGENVRAGVRIERR